MNKRVTKRLLLQISVIILITLALIPKAFAESAPVHTGLEVLIQQGYKPLLGKRVGLVTNHSAITADNHHIVDLFAANKQFTLTALFCPEHGIRGNHDNYLHDGNDGVTGLPMYSLYGKTKKPTAAMLKDVDVIVFDIQDLGTRFYTFISTLAYVMQAAKENNKMLVVLDRPNPINGQTIEGPLPEKRLLGKFTSYYAIPIRYGMTIGELARLYNDYFKIGCKLEVVKLQGWHRSMYFNDTKLPWINPSPNMRSLTAAINYPGLGVLEGANLSVGRGTAKPFIFYGAPWIDAAKLVTNLNARRLPGIYFQAVSFKPKRVVGMPLYPYTNKECFGFIPVITDRQLYRPVTVVMHVIDALYQLHPTRFKFGTSLRLLGQYDVKTLIKAGEKPEDIIASWNIKDFLRAREKALLYK